MGENVFPMTGQPGVKCWQMHLMTSSEDIWTKWNWKNDIFPWPSSRSIQRYSGGQGKHFQKPILYFV